MSTESCIVPDPLLARTSHQTSTATAGNAAPSAFYSFDMLTVSLTDTAPRVSVAGLSYASFTAVSPRPARRSSGWSVVASPIMSGFLPSPGLWPYQKTVVGSKTVWGRGGFKLFCPTIPDDSLLQQSNENYLRRYARSVFLDVSQRIRLRRTHSQALQLMLINCFATRAIENGEPYLLPTPSAI